MGTKAPRKGTPNPIVEKSFAFAIRTVQLYKYLTETKKEFVLSEQLLLSGTAIGARVREAEQIQSKDDFCHTMNAALKEANKTRYWLTLLYESGFITKEEFTSADNDADDLVKKLARIVRSTKSS